LFLPDGEESSIFIYEAAICRLSLILQLHSRADVQLSMHKNGSRCRDVNYGVLLLEFFELYGINFNYGWAGISVRKKGRYVKKTDGETTLYIEDPQSPGNPAGKTVKSLNRLENAVCRLIQRPFLLFVC
jgi:DNA polymerase sigma